MRTALFFAGTVAFARCVCAEPLAYWRLDAMSESLDLRNAVGTNHVLELCGRGVSASFRKPLAAVPEWDQLPAATRGSRYNSGSVFIEGSGGAFLCAPGLGRQLGLTRSFTVEGWLRKAADPASGAWYPLFGAGKAGTGWEVALRNEGGETRFHLRVDAPLDKLAWSHRFSASEVTGDYGWTHVALAYDVARAGSGGWELFVNGASCGVATNPVAPSDIQGFADFYLGGRAGSEDHTFLGQVDLWRVSDEALPAARLLNVPDSSDTVAYWPLDATPGSKPDLANRAGNGYALSPGKDGGVSGSDGQAVSQIPNNCPASRKGKREARANVGSVRFAGGLGQRSLLVAPELGLRCDLTNSFTVEGWFLKKGNPDERFWCLAGARDDSNGWMLSLRPEGGRVRFHLHVSDVKQGGRLQFERFFQNTDLSDCTEWCHVALVYDHTRDGYGVWELFLDGVPQGEIRNPAAPDRSHGWRDFTLGGRVSLSNSFVGEMDCWRVSSAPLAPEQFLCHVPDAEARTVGAARDDARRFARGRAIPVEAACGQPAVNVLRDGRWVCVAPESARGGKATARHVVATVSGDKGDTWSPPVEVVSAKGTNGLFATSLVTPFDRVYAFFCEEPDAATSNSVCRCVFSDDGGLTWSRERHRVPLGPPAGAGPRVLRGLGKPVAADGTVYIAFSAQPSVSAVPGCDAGGVLVSDNLLSERNVGRVRFKVLPEGGRSLCAPAPGLVQDAPRLIALGGRDLLCSCRAEGVPAPVQSVSRDGGCVWSAPERMAYGPGRRAVKADAAGVRLFGTREGRFVMCYRIPVLSPGSGGAPVLVSGGVSDEAGFVRWSEPELLAYDRDGADALTCEDMVEQDGRFWFTLKQAGVLRMLEADRALLDGLWRQESLCEVCGNGVVASCVGFSETGRSFAVPPEFGSFAGGGLSVELWVTPDFAAPGETLFSTRKGRRGIRVGTTSVKGLLVLRIELYDGDRQVVWHADPEVLRKDLLHHVVFVCDAVAGRLGAVVDGKVCDGGEKRFYGWGEIPAGLWAVSASERARISASVKQARLYDRALRTSEAVGNFRAGLAAR